ncbi:MAG: nucleoside triphosphate pyrophosphatase [Alphaproteobacteria bacterium]
MPYPPIILASASPRRLELLAQIGVVPAAVIAAELDETPLKAELPSEHVQRLAEAKARKVSEAHPGKHILAADTAVACGRRILPKAETPDDVRACLKLMSSRRHRVYGGICLVTPDGKARTRLIQSVVKFKTMTRDEIDAYAASGEGIGKAGGYAIQGQAAALIAFISGSYSNIVGLDLYATAQLLRGAGA